MTWSVAVAPDDEWSPNGANLAGLEVKLMNDEDRYETWLVARVAFARHNSRSPDTSFEDAIEEVLTKASLAVEILNDLIAEEETRAQAQAEAARKEAGKRIKEVLGTPSRSKKPA